MSASVGQIACVHCHSPVTLDQERPEGLVCPACGGVFPRPGGGGESTTDYMRRLGRFELLAQVGTGGFGTVWKARDAGLGRVVALKLFHRGTVGSAADRERFLREARAAAQLRHPGIVPVHEVTEIDGQPVIVADFIEGVTLRDLLQTRRLTFREAAELVAEVAAALDYAHALGIVHRDIKPANIMIELAGATPGTLVAPSETAAGSSGSGSGETPSATLSPPSRWRVLLLDFGLALRADVEPTLTAEGQILGTPAYMSPEQAAGYSHRVDHRSDIYSLGAVLYELLTGERPFRGSKPMLIRQVLHEEPRAPRRLNDRIPRDLETICLKALAKEPGRRYPTAGELAADLRRFLTSEPIRARPVAAWERAWKWVRRRPAVASLLVVGPVALLALVGLAVGLAYNSELDRARQSEEEQRQRAEAALDDSLTYLYFHRVAAAEREWQGFNIGRAMELLSECPPERRQWEWHYLDRLCHPELPVLTGHGDVVFSAVFSPDGSRVASASYDGTVRLWEARTGRELLKLPAHTGFVGSVAFSPDGRRLAAAAGAAGQPGPVKVWSLDPPAGGSTVRAREVHTLPAVAGDRCQVVFSPDGRLLALAGGIVLGKPGFAKLFSADGRQELLTLSTPLEGVHGVAFSPDSRFLATAGGRSDLTAGETPGLVQVWDVASGRQRQRSPVDPALAQAVAFSRDGRLLAVACGTTGVALLDARTLREIRRLRGYQTFVYKLAFSPDGKQLATGGDEGALKLWDPATGDELYTLRGHTSDVMSVAYDSKGERLVTAGADQTVRLWDSSAAQEARTFQFQAGKVAGVAFRGDRWVVSGGLDGTVQMWEPFAAGRPRVLGKHPEPVWCVAASPDGARVASASGDWQKRDQLGEVRVWHLSGSEPPLRLRAHTGLAWSVAFSPDGARLATAGGENFAPGEVKVWDARTGQSLLTIPQPHGVRQVVFSPDGRRLAGAVYVAGAVKVWDAATGQELFNKPANFPSGLGFSPDGRRLAAGTRDRLVLVWDLATGREQTLRGHRGDVVGLAFSPDGRRLASAGGEEAIRLWDVATGQEVLSLRGHHAFINAVAFSPDGHRLASASNDATVKVWDARPRGE